MKIVRNIRYSNIHDERGVGDLFLPEDKATGHPVLLIHGGGWNALAKESFEPFAAGFVKDGRAVFNVNYRLLDHAPWPACLEDCIAAGNFMMAGGLAGKGLPAAEKVLICGASAGGHLAMMTGLGLPKGKVEAIISMCGPSVLDFPDGSSELSFRTLSFFKKFLGRQNPPTQPEVDAFSPVRIVKPGAPTLYCVHSKNDELVTPAHSQRAVEAWRKAGSPAEAFIFDGPGDSHGIWDSEDRATRQPLPVVADIMQNILRKLRPEHAHR